MAFSAPVWLWALVPWAAAVALLLWGRLKRVKVPFLQLWQGPEARPRQRRAIELPPFAILMGMLAMLLAVLAAARPIWHTAGRDGPPLTIIVDRGVTMSARGQKALRYHEAVDLAEAAVIESLGPGPVELHTVPAREPVRTDRQGWAAIAKSWTATAFDTGDELRRVIRRALAETSGPVVVLTDHALEAEVAQGMALDPSRLVLIAPPTRPQNVGIVRLAIRESPIPQVMVRLRNQSAHSNTAVRIVSDGQLQVQTTLELPPKGERDYFLDVRQLGRAIELHLDVEDDLAADNVGYWVRQHAWPIVEARSPLPPELHRIIDLYGKLRPPAESSKRVAVVNDLSSLPLNEPAVVLASGSEPLAQPVQLQIVDHPIVAAVNSWSALLKEVRVSQAAEDPSWRPIVKAGAQVLVAVRDQPARAVWVRFASASWASRAEFVIFWTNVFTWLGEGGETFGPATEGVEAKNTLDVRFEDSPPRDWRAQLARLGSTRVAGDADFPLAGGLLLSALVAMVIAVLTWPGQRGCCLPTAGAFLP